MPRDADTPMTRLDELRLQRELKEIVLEYVTDIFAPAHPSHHGFAVLISRHDDLPNVPRDPARDREFVVVRAIVYLAADKTTWKLLWESQRPAYSILNALQSATMDLEREMGKVMEKVEVGDIVEEGREVTEVMGW